MIRAKLLNLVLPKSMFIALTAILFTIPAARASVMDAHMSVTNDQLELVAKIFIYGKAATPEARTAIEAGINRYWSRSTDGTPWIYLDPATQRKYRVSITAKVELYNGIPRINPSIIPESWDPTNRNNYIEIISDPAARNYVWCGDEGVWSFPARNENVYAHEFGHLLGFKDRYNYDRPKSGVLSCPDASCSWFPDKGWGSNIMSATAYSRVEQRNIDSIARRILNRSKGTRSYQSGYNSPMKAPY
jgi:hypothetical protein